MELQKSLIPLHKERDKIRVEIKSKTNEIKKLETILVIKVWDYSFGAIEQIDSLLSPVSDQCLRLSQGEYQLFTSDKAFEIWNIFYGDLDKKINYYAQGNRYIADCLENIDDKKIKIVRSKDLDLCKKSSLPLVSNFYRSRIGKAPSKKRK